MKAEWSPDSETILCISLAARPGNIGMTLHNAAYRALGLNYLYKAIRTTDLRGALIGVKALGIRACSLSMPFKEEALPLMDKVDDTARAVGAVNAIVNVGGILTGSNTDEYGARVVLEGLGVPRSAHVLVLGAGGVARAVLHALQALGYGSVTISNRSAERAASLAAPKGFEVVPWDARAEVNAQLIVNATSVGMDPDSDVSPIAETSIARATAIMDVVTNPAETKLIAAGRKLGKRTASGPLMSLHQAARQFELYTGKSAPLDVMEKAMMQLLASQAK